MPLLGSTFAARCGEPLGSSQKLPQCVLPPSIIDTTSAEGIAPLVGGAPDLLSASTQSLSANDDEVGIHTAVAPIASVAPGRLPVSSLHESAPRSVHGNLTLQIPKPPSEGRTKPRILLLCAGPNERLASLFNLCVKGGAECDNWDIVNGPQFDFTDDAAWEPLLARVRSKEYAAAFASPPCTTASRLRNKPGGPPPLRGLTGPDRYGLKGLSISNKELVRLHNLILLRVAEILGIMSNLGRPWVFETPALRDGEVSVLRLDEYQTLLGSSKVCHTIGVQCPFGAVSSKPTSWVSHSVDLSDMPQQCTHARKPWFNNRTGAAVVASHRPTAGTDTYSLTQMVRSSPGVFEPPKYVSASLAAYPDLLNRYLVCKLCSSLPALVARPARSSTVMLVAAPRSFSEDIVWRQRLRGNVGDDDKTLADAMAIGGLRNAAASVSRLHTLQAFGSSLGMALRALLAQNPSWIHSTCDLIGTTVLDARPPPEAILAVKSLLMAQVGCDGLDTSMLTRINSKLLARWLTRLGAPHNHD